MRNTAITHNPILLSNLWNFCFPHLVSNKNGDVVEKQKKAAVRIIFPDLCFKKTTKATDKASVTCKRFFLSAYDKNMKSLFNSSFPNDRWRITENQKISFFSSAQCFIILICTELFRLWRMILCWKSIAFRLLSEIIFILS